MSNAKPYLLPESGIEKAYDILVVDTEFTRLPFPKEAVWSWAKSARLLSVALVPLEDAPDPAHLYRFRKPERALLVLCHPFVVEQVVPLLEVAGEGRPFKDEKSLADDLRAYLAARKRLTHKEPALAVDWIGDAYLLASLFPTEPEWLLLDQLPEVDRALTEAFPSHYARHNAYHDAMAIRDGLRVHLAGAATPR